MKHKIAVVGAGFSGAIIAYRLARAGHDVEVFEAKSDLGGNCHTARDPKTSVMLHQYGPHIFHTADERVWRFVNQFAEIMPFVNRVKAISGGRVFTLPINLLTINQFFGKTFSPLEARRFIASLADTSIEIPRNFESRRSSSRAKRSRRPFSRAIRRSSAGVIRRSCRRAYRSACRCALL